MTKIILYLCTLSILVFLGNMMFPLINYSLNKYLLIPPSKAAVQTTKLPLQGVYELFALSDNWQPRLDQIAASGFKVLLNYSAIATWSNASTISTAQINAYANYANSAGLQIIWSLVDFRASKNPIGTFATLKTNLGATTNSDFVTKLTNYLQSLPATYGYYLEDELTTSDATELIALGDAIRSVDSIHPTIGVNTSNQWRAGDMQALEPAMSILGFDRYPIGQFATEEEQYADNQTRLNEVVMWLVPKRKPLMLVLQAYDPAVCYPNMAKYFPYHQWPTAQRITTLRDQFLNGAAAQGVPVQLILWYSYFDIMHYNPAAWDTLINGAFAPAPPGPAPTPTPTPTGDTQAPTRPD